VTESPIKPRRKIAWLSVLTVVSAAILISAEVFGAAFAGGWAVGRLVFDFGQDDWRLHVVQGIFFVIGIVIMAAFVRNASSVEPFTTTER
jgi:hypothetical protein